MEDKKKKGDILNQFALISDLFEKANIEYNEVVVVFGLNEDEFDKIYRKFYEKTKIRVTPPKDTFNVMIGAIKFIFNKSSV